MHQLHPILMINFSFKIIIDFEDCVQTMTKTFGGNFFKRGHCESLCTSTDFFAGSTKENRVLVYIKKPSLFYSFNSSLCKNIYFPFYLIGSSGKCRLSTSFTWVNYKILKNLKGKQLPPPGSYSVTVA